jgi:hypothetical protein
MTPLRGCRFKTFLPVQTLFRQDRLGGEFLAAPGRGAERGTTRWHRGSKGHKSDGILCREAQA